MKYREFLLFYICTTQTLYFFIILFMSQILHQGNNLVVTGEIGGEYYNTITPDGEIKSPENLRRTLFLTFIVQMNGKMVVHKEALCLVVDKQSTENPSLEEWNTWYVICNLFSSFWYIFSDEKSSFLYNSSGIIREWIDKLITEEKRTFYCTLPTEQK